LISVAINEAFIPYFFIKHCKLFITIPLPTLMEHNIDHLEKFALPDLKDIIRFDFVFDVSHVTLESVDEQEAIL
jgi:hypothetical protein